jgi:Flp pilus assembly protein TadD
MAEHRVYLASCGLFLVAGDLVRRLWRSSEQRLPAGRWLVGTAAALALAAFALDTMGRNLRWGNPVGLWSEAVQRSPDHFWPRLLLGEALMESEKPAAALEQFETAVRLAPSVAEPYAKVGICLISVGRSQEARAYLHAALARDPNNGSALQALAWLDDGAVGRSGGQRAADPPSASQRRD